MSVQNFGLVEKNAEQLGLKADLVLIEIEELRTRKDNKKIKEFENRYKNEFFYRLWNFNLSHAFRPVKRDDLTREKLIELLDELHEKSWFGWRSTAQNKRYIKVEHVKRLCDHSENEKVFVNEHHLEALEDRDFC